MHKNRIDTSRALNRCIEQNNRAINVPGTILQSHFIASDGLSKMVCSRLHLSHACSNKTIPAQLESQVLSNQTFFLSLNLSCNAIFYWNSCGVSCYHTTCAISLKSYSSQFLFQVRLIPHGEYQKLQHFGEKTEDYN